MNNESSILPEDQNNSLDVALKSAKELVLKYSKEGDKHAERYVRLLQPISEILPEEEKQDFLDDPIQFISKKLLFRGVGQGELIKILNTEAMKPQSGEYSTAVFTTDSPKGATDFVSENGALLVLNRDKIDYVDPKVGIEDENSPELIKKYRAYLDSLTPEQSEEAIYFPHNQFDTSSQYAVGSPWHTIHLRKEQSIQSVDWIVVFDSNRKSVKFDPNDSSQRTILEEIISEKY